MEDVFDEVDTFITLLGSFSMHMFVESDAHGLVFTLSFREVPREDVRISIEAKFEWTKTYYLSMESNENATCPKKRSNSQTIKHMH